MAAEPVAKARAGQVTVAVATVVVFGTLATFPYPALFQLNQHWALIPGGANGFGIYAGSTLAGMDTPLAVGADFGLIAFNPKGLALADWLRSRGHDPQFFENWKSPQDRPAGG